MLNARSGFQGRLMIQRLFFVSVLGVFTASTASADTYSDCEVAVANGETSRVIRLASQIRGFNFIPAHKRVSAAACVSAVEGEPFAYSPEAREFMPVAKYQTVKDRICELQELVAETNLTIRLAEAAKQERRIETLATTIQECTAWFDEDARAALTNDVCNSIFSSGGVPNSDVLGPSTSETLLAELVNMQSLAEIEFLSTTGIPLETLEALDALAETVRLANPDECDQ